LDSGVSNMLNPRSSFLIVSLRYIGDVLLSTPLALSIKTHLPEATVDYLVFSGTEGVLAKNRHVAKVHAIAPGISSLATFLKLFRRYDFALGINPSDRTAIYTLGAGRRSIGFSYFSKQEWWKKTLLSDCRVYAHEQHIVPLILTQLEPLGIPAIPRVIMGFDSADEQFARTELGENYVLLHPYTRQSYKYWPAENWRKLAGLIREMGLKPVFTRTNVPADEEQLLRIRKAGGADLNVFPKPFSLTQLAAAIRGSSGFVGVDTVGTHMAAALEAPTVALFGPTFVHNWGPWPNGCTTPKPFARAGQIQRHGAITVVQQNWDCVPCGQHTCPISKRDKIECLEAMAPEMVFEELKKLLATRKVSGRQISS
jgi:heptosyltransferase-3